MQARFGFSEHFDESGALGAATRLPPRTGRRRLEEARRALSLGARQVVDQGEVYPAPGVRHRRFHAVDGDARAIGSLALGVYDGDALRYVGRVGTGFTVAAARDLYRAARAIGARTSPSQQRLAPSEKRGFALCPPGLGRRGRFRRLDRRRIAAACRPSARCAKTSRRARSCGRRRLAWPTRNRRRRNVKLTHPDRVYWPDRGVTKQGLADYYAQVWPRFGPFIVGRPLALVRCPNGVDGPHFFQKHAWQGLDRNIVVVDDPKAPSDEPLIGVRDLDGVMALVQAATLEIHPWGSTFADWERPDTFIIDLDPGRGRFLDGGDRSGGRSAGASGRRAGLAGFVKTSGGKGMHVVAPLKPKADWPAVKAFAKADGRRDGGRQPRSLSSRRSPRRSAAARSSSTTCAISAAADCRRAVFDPRATGRGGVDAARLGRVAPKSLGPDAYHRRQRAGAAGVARPGIHGGTCARGGADRTADGAPEEGALSVRTSAAGRRDRGPTRRSCATRP